jgi:hypothetical protein
MGWDYTAPICAHTAGDDAPLCGAEFDDEPLIRDLPPAEPNRRLALTLRAHAEAVAAGTREPGERGWPHILAFHQWQHAQVARDGFGAWPVRLWRARLLAIVQMHGQKRRAPPVDVANDLDAWAADLAALHDEIRRSAVPIDDPRSAPRTAFRAASVAALAWLGV